MGVPVHKTKKAIMNSQHERSTHNHIACSVILLVVFKNLRVLFEGVRKGHDPIAPDFLELGFLDCLIILCHHALQLALGVQECSAASDHVE
jgi:hypothetical protein